MKLFRRCLILFFLIFIFTMWRCATNLENTEAQNLVRGPYLQSVTESSIVICWETDIAGYGQLEHGLTDSYGYIARPSEISKRYEITLTDLEPYTTYHYRIRGNEKILTEDSTFKTSASSEQTSFNFVAYGDTRRVSGLPAFLAVIDHREVANLISSLNPDFYLHTGDLVNNGLSLAEWNEFFEIEGKVLKKMPLFPTLGNHERNSSLYFDLFHLPNNERWYSFDYGNAHFVCLQVDGYARFDRESEQYKWLKSDLAKTNKLWKFVFFHLPVYSSGPHGCSEKMIRDVREILKPIFEQYGVDIVLSGHDHTYERSLVNGVNYIVTGGGGAELYSSKCDNKYQVHFEKVHHCVLISIEGNSLTCVGIRPDGTRFDLFNLVK